jgi:hypothetical protein
MIRNERSILARDVTFVVQGPILENHKQKITGNLIHSIRKYFPESKILLSTWVGENTKSLPLVEKIIYSSDPGAAVFLEQPRTFNNVNRQIVSTKRGLDEVNTKYAIKIRSDLILKNNKLLNSLSYLDPSDRNTEYKYLNSYVLVTNQTSVNPRKLYRYPFAICDWFWAGRTKDLLDIWDIKLMPEDWFRYFEEEEVLAEHGSRYLSRYFPETYITSTFIRKKKKIEFENSFDISQNNIELSEDIIANNFIIKSNWQLGIRSQKHHKPLRVLIPMYTFSDWRKMAITRNIKVKDNQFDALRFILPLLAKFNWVHKIVAKLKILLNSSNQNFKAVKLLFSKK